MNKSESLKHFNNDYNLWIGKLNSDLRKIEQITDLKQRAEKAQSLLSEYNTKEINLTGHYNTGNLSEEQGYSSKYQDFIGKVNKLKKISKEFFHKSNEDKNKEREQFEFKQKQKEQEWKSSHCAQCGKKSLLYHFIYDKVTNELIWDTKNASNPDRQWVFCDRGHFNQWWNNNVYNCDECNQQRFGTCSCCGKYQYWSRKKENDGKKFCSNNCTNKHYAENCDECGKKVLGDSYYNDYKNKTGIICPQCNRKRNQKSQELREKWSNLWDLLGREMKKEKPEVSWIEISTLCSLEEFKEKQELGELETYIQQKLAEIKQVRQNKSNNSNPDSIIPVDDDRRENPVVYCRFCNSKCSSILNVCSKIECLLKHDEEYAQKNNIPFDKKSREREFSFSTISTSIWNQPTRTKTC